jgi:hypothetical protein
MIRIGVLCQSVNSIRQMVFIFPFRYKLGLPKAVTASGNYTLLIELACSGTVLSCSSTKRESGNGVNL